MKNLFLILLFAVAVFGNTYTSASASLADVKTAYALASSGDTIQVADGDAQWDERFTITFGVVLLGGTGTITWLPPDTQDVPIIHYIPANPSANELFDFSGFTIIESDSASDDGGDFIIINNTAINTDILSNIKIHNNSFALKYRTRLLVLYGNPIFGVFYLNTISAVKGEFFGFYGNDDVYWDTFLPEYGTANSFFVEDNAFVTESYLLSYTGQTGGRSVIRYNDVTMDGTQLADIHGAYNNTCAGQICMLYGNDITVNPPRSFYTMYQRGGWSLVFYNYANYAHSPYIINESDGNTPCSHPNNPQSDAPENTYYWNQRSTASNNLGEATKAVNITENSNFWVMRAGTFDGTGDSVSGGGVGCGTLENRPATCSVGVGYWATDQNVVDITGYVGVNPSTPLSGTLYKATDTNTWTEYYTPYTYPHPLRGVSNSNKKCKIRVIR